MELLDYGLCMDITWLTCMNEVLAVVSEKESMWKKKEEVIKANEAKCRSCR